MKDWTKGKFSGEYSGPITPELSAELCGLFGIDPQYGKTPIQEILLHPEKYKINALSKKGDSNTEK